MPSRTQLPAHGEITHVLFSTLMPSPWIYPIDRATTQTPSDYLFHHVDTAVRYGRDCWRALMTGGCSPDPVPMFTDAYMAELRHMATVFAKAAKNPIVLDWDASAYAAAVGAQDGGNATFEEILQKQFPHPDLTLSQPATIVDCAGVIQLWYGPEAFQVQRQTQAFVGFEKLHEILQHNGPKKSGEGSWRKDGDYFAAADIEAETPRGLATFAVWHAQGHDRYTDEIYVSADLGGQSSPLQPRHSLSRDWVANELELAGLLSLGIAIPSPEQYALSRECILRLAERRPNLAPIVSKWPFASNAVSIISNRSAPDHRDGANGRGGSPYYDGVTTFGGDERVVMHLKGLGLRCQYSSGTMLTFSGHTHIHGVSDALKDRICVAIYARRSVHAAMDLPPPRPVTLESLLRFP